MSGHGPIRRLGSILRKLIPGSIFYPLNSQEPLVVVFPMENSVVTNTAEIFFAHRPIRCCGEWVKQFPFNWEGFKKSEKLQLDETAFSEEDFEEGMMVILLSEDRNTASVEILIGMTDEAWLTDDAVCIPFSANDRIFPTGLKYTTDDDKPVSESEDS